MRARGEGGDSFLLRLSSSSSMDRSECSGLKTYEESPSSESTASLSCLLQALTDSLDGSISLEAESAMASRAGSEEDSKFSSSCLRSSLSVSSRT